MTRAPSLPTPAEYIQSHLQNLNNIGQQQTQIIDWQVLNWDTIVWSVLAAGVVILVLFLCVRKLTTGVPGRFQAAIEMAFEAVDKQSKNLVHGDCSFIAPLALTVFAWIALMNLMDLVPVDWVLGINFLLSSLDWYLPHHRAVATTDLNATLGASCSVIIVTLYYSIKIKGLLGFCKEWLSAPFGPWLAPINLVFNIIEHLSKAISLGMRLFGNMYAGELVFLLIALLGAIWHFDASVSGILGFLAHIILGSAWAIFHVLIVFLQAFIFMMLTLIYVGQAHEWH